LDPVAARSQSHRVGLQLDWTTVAIFDEMADLNLHRPNDGQGVLSQAKEHRDQATQTAPRSKAKKRLHRLPEISRLQGSRV